MIRFGAFSLNDISENIGKSVSDNTKRSKAYIWGQFTAFCSERNYQFDGETTDIYLANILKDWAYNMRKMDGQDYKESTVKTVWNTTSKILMEKFYNEYGRKINPFDDVTYKEAREARNAKRKELQTIPEKRKQSSTSLCYNEFKKLVDTCDENTPDGLIKKVFYVFSYELAWRGGEATKCMHNFFKPEIDNIGNKTGRIEYNSIFSKTAQGGNKKCADSKWLVTNNNNPSLCPVRLFNKYVEKRRNVSCDRFFLTANPISIAAISKRWYKNVPVGRNTMSTWTHKAAKTAGLDLDRKKITNHSLRASAVTALAKNGVGEEQLIKITGHTSTSSIRPYLQLDEEHHENIIKKMRGEQSEDQKTVARSSPVTSVPRTTIAALNPEGLQSATTASANTIYYNNCVFNCNTLYCSK